ncbi:MAG: DNA/RNA non-specific endonuclease [Ruminococcus sp.]
MNSEISNNEVKEVINPSAENFKNIKPENEMTSHEVAEFWKSEFHDQSEQAKADDTASVETTGSSEYYDDNGTKYREGDSLLPNTQFEIRGYQYETDDQGRVVSAEGQLRMRDPSYEREMEDVRKIDGQEYKTTDDRGHLIGHQFDGSDKLENLVPMDAKLNQGDFVKLENTLADAVKDGVDVRLRVEPVYEGNSTRPSEFRVTYSIDGDKDAVVFKNESEAKT